MKTKILVVEDEVQILEMISEILKSNDYEVITAVDGVDGYEKYKQYDIDMVLTDVMMPNMDGFQLVKLIRSRDEQIPIILLTALDDEGNEVKGFDYGINDYISKPFSFTILLKRIAAQEKSRHNHLVLKLDAIEIDIDAHVAKVDDLAVDLTVKEFEILAFLMQNANRVVTREQILDEVWGYDHYGDIRNVDTHMKNLRRKIEDRNIKTVQGVGYNFVT